MRAQNWPDIYGELTGKTILRDASIPKLPVSLTPDLLKDTNRAIAVIEAELAKGGIEAVADGEKFVRLPRAGWNLFFIIHLARRGTEGSS
jgi:hypothetical protein